MLSIATPMESSLKRETPQWIDQKGRNALELPPLSADRGISDISYPLKNVRPRDIGPALCRTESGRCSNFSLEDLQRAESNVQSHEGCLFLPRPLCLSHLRLYQ